MTRETLNIIVGAAVVLGVALGVAWLSNPRYDNPCNSPWTLSAAAECAKRKARENEADVRDALHWLLDLRRERQDKEVSP